MKIQRTRIASYAIVQNNGKILLCRLSEQVPQWQGYWALPGGGIDFGEDPQAAMEREVMEETGLTVSANGIAGVDSRFTSTDEEDFHAIRLIYNANYIDGDLAYEINGTTDQCAWFMPSELDSLKMIDLTRVGIELLRNRSQ